MVKKKTNRAQCSSQKCQSTQLYDLFIHPAPKWRNKNNLEDFAYDQNISRNQGKRASWHNSGLSS